MFLYFAYGSNMLTERLVAGCPSATVAGLARADDFTVRFSKPSKDGSGKATLVAAPGSTAYGVLFNVADSDLRHLDEAEGVDYRRVDDFSISRLVGDGETVRSTTYIASALDDTLQPFDWYVDLVLAGCKQHGLPDDYARHFRETPFIVDLNEKRQSAVAARRLLAQVGFQRG